MHDFKKDETGYLLLTNSQAATLYLDYFNNFLTLRKFAEYLNTSEDDAKRIIERGRITHERAVENAKISKIFLG